MAKSTGCWRANTQPPSQSWDTNTVSKTNNYLKVHPAPFGMTPRLIVPFDDSDPESVRQAWLAADAIRAQLDLSQPREGREPRYIAIWKEPKFWPRLVPRLPRISYEEPAKLRRTRVA